MMFKHRKRILLYMPISVLSLGITCIDGIAKILFCFVVVLAIGLALTTIQAKNIAITRINLSIVKLELT